RVVVVYAYAFLLLYWFWRGYLTYRNHYREADWAPIDDSIDRLRGHPWGQAGLIIVIMFVVLATWAPALGPVTAEENLYEPYQNEHTYLNENGEVTSSPHGTLNIQTRSNGNTNVGPLEYDRYDRWAPFGTNSDGKDLFTFLAYGARTSLVIGLLATGLSAGFALALAMITSYYRGLVDLVAVIGSDSIQSVPFVLLVILLFVVLREANHPIVNLYDGGILLALILAFVYWPSLWRSIRGPSLQIAQAEWIDAAKSFGQRPSVTMRKHMAPYVVIYIIIYASLVLGTIVITTAALSFLGIGINPPTPEWGRMIAEGRSFVSTKSWHVATIPGILIVLVVTGFNAFGDALRDALDVQADIGSEGGGGGA
ncbi:ABC transporter permease, partial [Halobacteriales archaeon SW_7_65_23]